MSGCEKCRIFANQGGTAAKPLAQPYQTSALVTGGTATLSVPTKLTAGMSFTVSCTGDRCNASNAQPVVVLQYQGQSPGSTVPDSKARTEKKASGCWAGTTAASVALPLSVTFFPDQIFDRKAHSMRIWANPQVAVVPGTFDQTWHGGLGTQDEVLC